MKPSAFIHVRGQGQLWWERSVDDDGNTKDDDEPLYSLSDLKAWLMEEPSFEVIHAAVESYDSSDGSMVEYCRGLFAAKLEELK